MDRVKRSKHKAKKGIWMAGHTGGYKFRCPKCDGLVFEDINLEDGTLRYWCRGKIEEVVVKNWWSKDKRIEKRRIPGCGWGRAVELVSE